MQDNGLVRIVDKGNDCSLKIKDFFNLIILIFCIFLLLYLRPIYHVILYYANKSVPFKLNLMNFYITEFNLSFIDNTPFDNTKFAYNIRKKLFYKYKYISSQYLPEDYSSIAFFYYIDREYYNFLIRHKNTNFINNDYYNLYIRELENILKKYPYVNNIDNPLVIYIGGSSYSFSDRYPYRAFLYHRLLKSYKYIVEIKPIEKKKNNLKLFESKTNYIKLQDIYNPQLHYINTTKYIKKHINDF